MADVFGEYYSPEQADISLPVPPALPTEELRAPSQSDHHTTTKSDVARMLSAGHLALLRKAITQGGILIEYTSEQHNGHPQQTVRLEETSCAELTTRFGIELRVIRGANNTVSVANQSSLDRMLVATNNGADCVVKEARLLDVIHPSHSDESERLFVGHEQHLVLEPYNAVGIRVLVFLPPHDAR